MEETNSVAQGKQSEGIVVWDHRGVVVVWPSGQSKRFSWETLQHLSLCPECLEHRHPQRHFPPTIVQ